MHRKHQVYPQPETLIHSLPASPGSAAALPEEAEVVVEQDPDLYADTEPLEYVTV